MKIKRRIALNELFVPGLLVSGFCLWLAVALLLEGTVAEGIVCLVLGLLAFAGMVLFQPSWYLFDPEGVTLFYLFLPSQRYLWDKIRAIRVEEDEGVDRPNLFNLFWGNVFAIQGSSEGKEHFYMEGYIRKTRRTRRLLERYWDGTITGYFGEDVKKWRRRRWGKKQRESAPHITDEIAPMEREARAKTRAFLAPFRDQAAQYDLELRVEYRYVTEDFDELNSRPAEGYTYTALVKIAHPGETDEARIVCVSADLLFVRLGRTAYRGVENEKALPELREMLTETLKEIYQNGIEAYCR